MRNKRFNKELLSEEIKKFKILSEYAFYEDKTEDNPDNLILGNNMFEEDEEGIEELEPTDNTEEPSEDPGFNDEEPTEDLGFGDEEPSEEPSEEPIDDMGFGDEEPIDDMGFGDEEPAGDEVELDVTELVNSSKEAKESADAANEKISQLMSMIDSMTNQLTAMDAISSKIDSLEKELEKRAPTPEEKIEMRSLDSYPYNLKLTDFWSTQKNQYDVIPDEKKEFVLDDNDIEKDYSDAKIKDTFDVSNEYEEEEF
jgi:hypothetical protein